VIFVPHANFLILFLHFQLAHDLWIQPISILVGLGILISLLGPSALVGYAPFDLVGLSPNRFA
jgi:hypothetical protein